MRRRGLPVLVLILAALVCLAPGVRAADAGARSKPRVFLGVSVFDMKLDIDSTMDIAGPTRFFSSRHTLYAGGRIMVHSGRPFGKTFYIGQFAGFGWGKNGFLLNWETPGLISYEPLEADITFGYLPFGVDFNLVVADILQLSAFVSAKWMFQKLTIEIDGDEFDGKSSKLVGAVGGMAAIDLGGLTLSAGAGLNHFVNAKVEWDVDDITFDSEHTKPSVEYFAGVILQ